MNSSSKRIYCIILEDLTYLVNKPVNIDKKFKKMVMPTTIISFTIYFIFGCLVAVYCLLKSLNVKFILTRVVIGKVKKTLQQQLRIITTTLLLVSSIGYCVKNWLNISITNFLTGQFYQRRHLHKPNVNELDFYLNQLHNLFCSVFWSHGILPSLHKNMSQ